MYLLDRHVNAKKNCWICKECGYTDRMGMKLLDHVDMAHLEAGHYLCAQCGTDFNFRGSLQLLKRDYRLLKYCTPVVHCSCGSKYKKQEALIGHQVVCPVIRGES